MTSKQQLIKNLWLNELRGKTLNVKNRDAAFRYLRENKAKALGYSPVLSSLSLVSVTQDREILGIGGSKPNDLILDNLGLCLTTFAHAYTEATVTVNLADLTNTPRVANVLAGTVATVWNNSAGSGKGGGIEFQVGKSVTAPTRGDTAIGTACSTAPENAPFALSSSGSYTAGSGKVTGASGAIVAGSESATINEDLTIMFFDGAGGTLYTCAIFHDAVTPGVPFSVGQTITQAIEIDL